MCVPFNAMRYGRVVTRWETNEDIDDTDSMFALSMPNTTDSDSCDSISRRAAAAWYNWIKLSSLSVTRCEQWSFRPWALILWKRALFYCEWYIRIDWFESFFSTTKIFLATSLIVCSMFEALQGSHRTRLLIRFSPIVTQLYLILKKTHLWIFQHEPAMRDERERVQRKKKRKAIFLWEEGKKRWRKASYCFFCCIRTSTRESEESNSTRKKYAFRHAYLDSSNKLPKKSRAKAKTRRKIRRAKVFFSFPFFSFL